MEQTVEQLKDQLRESERKWQTMKIETQKLYDVANAFMKCDSIMQLQQEAPSVPQTHQLLHTTSSANEDDTFGLGDINITLPLTDESQTAGEVLETGQPETRGSSSNEIHDEYDIDVQELRPTKRLRSTSFQGNLHASRISDLTQRDMTVVSSVVPFQDDSIFQFEFDDTQLSINEIASFLDPAFLFTLPVQRPPIWTLLPDVSLPMVSLDVGLKEIYTRGAQLHPLSYKQELSSSIGTAITGTLTPHGSDSQFPICSLVARWMISNFGTHFSSDFVNFVGVLYNIYALIRWRVVPTKETYKTLPDCMKPNLEQLQTPHSPWMDTFPWPKARSQMVKSFTVRRFDLFSDICASTTSMNWPLGVESVLIWSPDQGKTILNPAYERHVSLLENWSLGLSILEIIPSLQGLVRCKPDPVRVQPQSKNAPTSSS